MKLAFPAALSTRAYDPPPIPPELLMPDGDVPLKDYLDALHEATQRQLADIRHERELLVSQFYERSKQTDAALREDINRRLAAMDEATRVAKLELGDKLAGMNEIRGALRDAQANMVDKDTFRAELGRLRDAIDAETDKLRSEREALSVRVRDLEGNSASNSAVEGYKRWLIATALGLAGLAVMVFFNFFRLFQKP